MPKTKPIQVKQVHTEYTYESQLESINRIRELLAEAFIEFHNSNNKPL